MSGSGESGGLSWTVVGVPLCLAWRVAFFYTWLYACERSLSWNPWTAKGELPSKNEDELLMVGPYIYTAFVERENDFFRERYRKVITEAYWVFCWVG